ncbi:MAG: lasso peptide biosynthesis B2 protein [Acidobacteriia bacterium]|nr:lasso peptide biosynthesis B2 protein [Terriglobia bacterium]
MIRDEPPIDRNIVQARSLPSRRPRRSSCAHFNRSIRGKPMNEGRKTLPEKWRGFRNRPPEERALIVRAAILLPLTEACLRLFGFRRYKHLIEKFSSPRSLSQPMPVDAQRGAALRAVRAVRSVELHGPSRPNCLERSMTLWWLLRRDGIDGELHIGARKEDGKLKAHAWVELRGEILNDSAEIHAHYARFDAPIAAAEESSGRAGGALKPQ